MRKVLKERFGCEVVGIERDAETAAQAKRFCKRVIVKDCETMNYKEEFRSETFDVTIFADILEHLVNPQAVLEGVRGLIRYGGYEVVSIPNIAHVSVILELLSGQFTYRPLGILDNTHLRFFTRKSIEELFEKSGYLIRLIDRVKVPPAATEFRTVRCSIRIADKRSQCCLSEIETKE